MTQQVEVTHIVSMLQQVRHGVCSHQEVLCDFKAADKMAIVKAQSRVMESTGQNAHEQAGLPVQQLMALISMQVARLTWVAPTVAG